MKKNSSKTPKTRPAELGAFKWLEQEIETRLCQIAGVANSEKAVKNLETFIAKENAKPIHHQRYGEAISLADVLEKIKALTGGVESET